MRVIRGYRLHTVVGAVVLNKDTSFLILWMSKRPATDYSNCGFLRSRELWHFTRFNGKAIPVWRWEGAHRSKSLILYRLVALRKRDSGRSTQHVISFLWHSFTFLNFCDAMSLCVDIALCSTWFVITCAIGLRCTIVVCFYFFLYAFGISIKQINICVPYMLLQVISYIISYSKTYAHCTYD